MKVTTEKIRGVWTVRFTQEHQSFVLSNDYGGEKKDCKWVKKMLQIAFENYRKEILAEATDFTMRTELTDDKYEFITWINSFGKGACYGLGKTKEESIKDFQNNAHDFLVQLGIIKEAQDG